jgi:hypothetical protein
MANFERAVQRYVIHAPSLSRAVCAQRGGR